MPPFECVLKCSNGKVPNSKGVCTKQRPWWIFGLVGGLLVVGAIIFYIWWRRRAIKKAQEVDVDVDAAEVQKMVNKAKAEELKEQMSASQDAK